MIDASVLAGGRVVVDVVLTSSLRAVVLIAPVWLALYLIRPRRPALRHGVWRAVLGGVLLLPALSLLSLLPQISQSVVFETAIPVAVIPGWSSAEVQAMATHRGASVDWRGLAGLLTALVTSILLLRSVFTRRRVFRLIARADAITQPAARQLLQNLLGATKLSRPPKLVSSPEVTTPAVFGCFRPIVILPATWPQWSRAKLRAVLLHELAHIARRDAWVMAAASFNVAVFWFHPLAHWLRKELRMLAEMACDDHAVSVDRDPEGYAETLLAIAEGCQEERALPATAPAMAHTARVTRRIERILRNSTFHSGMLRRAVRRRLTLAALSATTLLSLVSITLGQSGGATLFGSVQDGTGARIPGATVLVVDSNRGTIEATATGADGAYRLEGLAPSDYAIEVRAGGFAVHNQTVDLAADTQLDITLALSPIEEAIVIAGKRLSAASSEAEAARRGIRVGGNVEKAKLIHHVRPIYPPDAEREGVEGTVLLGAVISKRGEPRGLTTLNTLVDQRLATAAIEAVRNWRYQPVLLNGEPVEVGTTISVVFQLP